ncbi:hypothetical protein [Candidatus Nitrotoga sp. 1052]|uniref:hypothetical protein n=1 Tax=Candidatus Nitrotoga sp. 1052 TaxID=2886964 RepID=UPI001EF73E66|nr:hypothetical protein [Candidatus Nitrotoga sp. 1052]CAH1073395.1 hypothetical protein NTG1052_20076 [Candidatus Nitrotoga sp. 1052]
MSISDEHCLAIGKISVAFAELESWLSSFIWSLISSEQHVGQMVTAEMSFSRKLDLLVSLFQYRCKDAQEHDHLKALVSRLSDLEQRPNTVQHSLWIRQTADPTEATRLKITAKRKHGLSHAKEVLTSQPLESLARNLQVAVSELSSFMVTFLAK